MCGHHHIFTRCLTREHWERVAEIESGGVREGGLGKAGQGAKASWRGSLLTNPVLPAEQQGAADSRGQGAASEGQVPARSAEPAHAAARVPGKGDPAAQQGRHIGSGPLDGEGKTHPIAGALNLGGVTSWSASWHHISHPLSYSLPHALSDLGLAGAWSCCSSRPLPLLPLPAVPAFTLLPFTLMLIVQGEL